MSFWSFLIVEDWFDFQACVLFAYFDAKDSVPEQMPVLQYWPAWSRDMGIPYIVFKVAGFKPTRKDYWLYGSNKTKSL